MKKITAGHVLLTILLLSTASRAELLDKRISFEASSGYEFEELCESLDLVCGIEVDFTVYKDIGTLELHAVTGRDGLAAVMSRYPGHRWRIQDGVLLVYPKKKEKSPLDLPVSHLSFNKLTFTDIRRLFAKEMKLKSSSVSLSGAGGGFVDNTEVSFEARDIIIRDALTRIVKTRGHDMWIFKRYTTSEGEPFYSLKLESFVQPPATHLPSK